MVNQTIEAILNLRGDRKEEKNVIDQKLYLTKPSIGSFITSKPLADRKDFVLLPKAIKNPNIAKSFSKTCCQLIFNFNNSIYMIETMQLHVHKSV